MLQYCRFLSKIILMLKKIPVRAACIDPRILRKISQINEKRVNPSGLTLFSPTEGAAQKKLGV